MKCLAYVFFSTRLMLAHTHLIRRTTYGATTQQLREELLGDWYLPHDDNTSAVEAPSNPTAYYSCAGPMLQEYPRKDSWQSFNTLWTINEAEITAVNGGAMYNADLREAIEEISEKSKVDARLILTLVLQESSGNMSIPCTGLGDCGLLQHRGSRSFDPSDSKRSIKNMLIDGIYGTAPNAAADTPNGWPGFLTFFNGLHEDLFWIEGTFWQGNPYAAGHLYNAGLIHDENLTEMDGGVVRSKYYANDMVSRLQGWNGWSAGCVKSRECVGHGFEDRQC